MEDACAPSTWPGFATWRVNIPKGRKLGHGTAKGWATIQGKGLGGVERCHAAHADLGI